MNKQYKVNPIKYEMIKRKIKYEYELGNDFYNFLKLDEKLKKYEREIKTKQINIQ